jgi:hypothetical protein
MLYEYGASNTFLPNAICEVTDRLGLWEPEMRLGPPNG